jgi:hypothetical protein
MKFIIVAYVTRSWIVPHWLSGHFEETENQLATQSKKLKASEHGEPMMNLQAYADSLDASRASLV